MRDETPKPPLVGISVVRVQTDYGINAEDYGPEDKPEPEDRHSAEVTLTLRLRPLSDDKPIPELEDINQKVEAIVSGLKKMHSEAWEERKLRRDAEREQNRKGTGPDE